jgi:hypothetical protein
MKRTTIFISILTLIFVGGLALAVESSKPNTHDSSWERRHGKVSAGDDSECLSCHIDRLDCITCHQDQKPRDHTSAYVYKGHALKAKWSRQSCTTCHNDSAFCDECHEITPPSNHVKGWGGNIYQDGATGATGRHCITCHEPRASLYGSNPVSRTCKTCHQTLPVGGNTSHTM